MRGEVSMPQTETGGHWDGLTGLMVEHGQRVRERDEALARADRLADRAVMLESRLARVTDLLRWGIEHERVCGRGQDLLGNFYDALAVAEGES
jgi:hypothetical protein